MKPFMVSLLLVTALALNYVAAQAPQPAQAPPAQAPLKIDKTILRLDPSLDKIVSPDAQLETIKDNEFRGGEGPVWRIGLK